VRAEDVESARRLGIRAVILKPNTVEELGATLHALLNERTTKAVTE
jgi:DNA-binding NarL/FixJ family response regulator